MESGGAAFAERLLSRFRTWPAVRVAPADCGAGVGLDAGTCQVLHLHSADTAELLLTRPVIERLGKALRESGRVTVRPGEDWVQVRLATDSDVALAVSLTSVALKAAGDGVGTRQTPPCSAAGPVPAALSRCGPP